MLSTFQGIRVLGTRSSRQSVFPSVFKMLKFDSVLSLNEEEFVSYPFCATFYLLSVKDALLYFCVLQNF